MVTMPIPRHTPRNLLEILTLETEVDYDGLRSGCGFLLARVFLLLHSD
jgi:hypothetical protein